MVFSGKTAIVTGAGSGVGRAIAVGLCADGADVVGIGRTLQDLEQTAALCEPGRMQFVVGDVSRPEAVERLYAEAFRRHGKVDILVNNAALYPKVGFLESSHEDWSRVIQTNVLGVALCCRAVLPGMLERGHGRILNLGSFAWKGPIPKSSAYAASKGAVRALTRALAAEIDRARHPDVLVNEFIPGIVRTRMSETGLDPGAVYPHARFVASLPPNGPTGQTFLLSSLQIEDRGLRFRLKQFLRRVLSGR
jgi:NAD(P)-dependent dehydrogenase (short-subunit alcohol dehydrogenase family)